jgi:WD40 repeat protein
LSAETRVPVVLPSETAVPLNVLSTDVPSVTPTDTISLIGTVLPEISETIGADTYQRLKRVGQWGRGSILGVGFSPDGKSFVAISELGWSIYNMGELDQPPQWVGFDRLLLFDEFAFSSDGTMIKFTSSDYQGDTVQLRGFPYGEILENGAGATWLEPDLTREYSDISLRSPDGTKLFKSALLYEFNEQIFSEEKTVREMYDANGNLLFALRDDAPYVTYSDRNGPEGCDLSVFSPCGNALMAVATTPVKALFSPDGSTFAALYDPPSLYSGIMKAFSYVRIYGSANGDLLGSLGGFTKPIQDFAYSPDGRILAAGFVDGSIILWDVKSGKSILGTRHMNAPAWKLVYSYDSRYLLIQRAEELEVRLSRDGALLYRFDAVEFAVSPLRNLLALGDDEGNIQIRDLDSGQSIRSIKAHESRIYSLAFSQDGFYLASSGKDCDIKLWELESGKLLHYFEETAVDAYEIGSPSRIFHTYLEFIPGKNMLIGFGSWGTVVNWNVNSGATNYVIQSNALEYYNGMITLKPHFPEFFDVDTVTDRFYLNESGFNLVTGESLGVYERPASLPEGCAPIGPVTLDKQLMFTRGYEAREGKVCVLHPETMALLGEVSVMPENAGVEWLYLSPNGRQLIITVGSGVVYVYQIV